MDGPSSGRVVAPGDAIDGKLVQPVALVDPTTFGLVVPAQEPPRGGSIPCFVAFDGTTTGQSLYVGAGALLWVYFCNTGTYPYELDLYDQAAPPISTSALVRFVIPAGGAQNLGFGQGRAFTNGLVAGFHQWAGGGQPVVNAVALTAVVAPG